MKTVFQTVSDQSLLPLEKYSGADGCGLPPVKPPHTDEANNRKKHPEKWADYDRKKKAHDECRSKKKEEHKEKKEERKQNGGGFINKLKRFNPLSTMVRGGVLAAFRVNLFAMATRMYPAFLTDDEIKAKRFKKGNAANAKAHWTKLATFWEKKLGGKKENLERDIKNGYNKPIFKTKAVRERMASGFGGSETWTEIGTSFPDITYGMDGGEIDFLKKINANVWKNAPDYLKSNAEGSNTGCPPGTVQGYWGNCLPSRATIMHRRANPKAFGKSGHYHQSHYSSGSSGFNGKYYTYQDKLVHNTAEKSNVDAMYRFQDKMIHNKTSDITGSRDYDIVNQFSNVVGADDVAEAVLTAMPAIATIVKSMNDAKLDKNPYEAGANPDYDSDLTNSTNDGDMNTPPVDESELKKITDAGEQDAKNGGAADSSDKIWGMPKPVVYVGGAVLLIILAWLGYKMFGKKGKK